MTLELLERPGFRASDTFDHNVRHDCATCRHKERVYVTAPNGRQTAAIWRCRTMSQRTQEEVVVQPHENCFEHRSLTDHWEPTEKYLVR